MKQIQKPSLATSQENLEAATKELRLAQKAFQAAATRLQAAEEGHTVAMTTLNADIWSVKAAAKVTALNAL